ncbi:hypothetical protein I4I73_10920 [Pseudonocardia sp. KRD-184]|uniref:Glycosyltransferase RgtA/B/C/D-like domain-containing protein n=1 Tax=Pseudonocardia oceani TaxID=2792013 RepID=A0ABS6U5I3_9PSEU|nr:hypothetical protein [Pseudonocardia oceani]MBW0089573.1 hypothetical protein [Pseudonocardia oceani]MBW0096499.1 hypothetical protein [Pseudonocardia oceani]MBW0122759.1 hypothetical protein [Pseudonocardia oceani]MBW0127487.1 hypothetical protein [Pseudonocardia oceani]
MAVREHVAENLLQGIQRGEAQHSRYRLTALVHSAVAATCLLLSVLAVHHTADKVPDDAFIILRYAQNLLDGHGWVYNLHHSTTNAVSAPLYTLLLALLGSIFRDMELATTLLFVFTTAASGYLTFLILRKNAMTLGGLAAMCLMIINPWLLATRGLETSAFICLLLLAVLLQGAGKHAALGFALVAATLVRGDGAVFAAVVFVLLWIQFKHFPMRLMAGAAAAIALWALTALAINIPIIPDTFAAKVAQGRSGLWGDMLYLRGFAVSPKVFGFMEWATVAALMGGIGILLVGGLFGLRRYLGAFILGVALLFAAYGLIIRPPSYHWYYGPQLALMALCGGIAISVISRASAVNFIRSSAGRRGAGSDDRLKASQSVSQRAGAVALAVAVFATGVMTVVGWRDIIRGVDRPEYLDTASWLKANTPEDATVALAEIGIVGWFSDREMIDFLGLLSKDSVREIANRDPISWLTREEPDYWVVHQPQWAGMEAAASEPWFALAYQPVWSNGKVVVWQRFRAIAEAKYLTSTLIQPTASQISAQLGVPYEDEATRRAIATLMAIFQSRSDLQAEYLSDERFDLAGLLGWATSPAGATDRHGATVQEFAPTYSQTAQRAAQLAFGAPTALP